MCGMTVRARIVRILVTCVSLSAGAATLHVPGEYATIQAAIDAAGAGDTVLVADGVYMGPGNRDIDLRGKAITVRSANGPAHCVIDCAASESDMHRGFVLHSSENRASVIEGFTITNGVESTGAGILCTNGTSPTIRKNIIRGNHVPFDWDGGGGIACRDGAAPMITGNVIEGNHCEPGSGGGGIHCYAAGWVTIRRNIIRGNSASNGGGIEIAAFASGGDIESNLIVDNTGPHAAGVSVWTTKGHVNLCGNTIVANAALYSGGGIRVDDGSEAAVINCIVWGNTDTGASVERAQIDTGSAEVDVSHCCIQDWSGRPGVDGNFAFDPLFVDSAAGDYHVIAKSPCIDSGMSGVAGYGETDLDGNPRVMGRLVDIGAYESFPPVQQGVYRVIDLGTLGGLYSEAKAINDGGRIVGSADTEEGIGHACRFVHENPANNIDLRTLGGRGSIAYAINNLGRIVGSSNFGWGEKASAVLFDASGAGANIDLGTDEERSSGAYGINDLGQIVGGTFHANGRWRATLFDPTGGGDNLNLGNLGSYASNDDSVALAINGQSVIVGHAQYQSGSTISAHAARFDPTGGGVNVHLGGSAARAVNEAGQIVGSGDGQAMLFDSTGGLNNRTLGLPADALWGQACGVNARGDAVGSITYADPEQDFVDHAALFDIGGERPAVDFNTLIDPDSGWVLRCANDINDRGWIVGLGINPQGRHRAFLLVPGSQVLYVDDSAAGANNGSSWKDALTNLEDALAAATAATEIRVAQGVYGPEDSGGTYSGRKTAFELKRGVTIQGGYAGCGATNPDARDTAIYASILRGGISGDRADATAVLDGLTVTGSGMHNIGGEPTVIGCTFESNSNPTGGAVTNIDADPTFVDCLFRNNRATNDDGGGGAMFNSDSDAMVKGCRFVGNFAEGNGGGMWNTGGSRPVLTNCIFDGNGSNGGGAGGAICNEHGSRPKLTNCTVVSNRDSGCAWGSGGMYSDSSSGATVLNCIFRGNTYFGRSDEAGQMGGGDPGDPDATANYSCIEGWTGVLGGVGNMGADPLFVALGHWQPAGEPDWIWDDLWVDGDYHLKSQAGRWDAAQGQWVQDEATSPCIDAGDAISAIMHEPFPNGGVVNMGAYGGTAQASKSWFGAPVCEVILVGDLNGDCVVGLGDMALMAAHWLQGGRCHRD